jgi:fructokinase
MIVSCGEALIDFLPLTARNGENAYMPRPGGAPFNVAVAVARLGVPAGFFGGLSTDAFGEMLRGALRASGVDLEFATIVSRPSSLAFVSFMEGEERYAFFDEGSAGRMLTGNDLPAFPTTVTALHFGSISLTEEPCGSAFETLMQREQRDRLISLDPNVRPEMIKNREGYVARIERMVAMSDVVRLSRRDLAYLAPGSSIAMVASRWLDLGVKAVVLTNGSGGVEARTMSASAVIDAPPAPVVDTVGAGDAFIGALLAHLHREGRMSKEAVSALDARELERALTFAARAAAISLSRAGADPAWLREIA